MGFVFKANTKDLFTLFLPELSEGTALIRASIDNGLLIGPISYFPRFTVGGVCSNVIGCMQSL